MTVARLILFAALVAAVGCSESKQGGGQPPDQEDWRDKKLLGEMRAKSEVIKDKMRRLQGELNAKDPKKVASNESGGKEWRPHEDYLSDPTYKMLHTNLLSVVEFHNSILDRNPTWNMPRLDVKLE